jgi:hypothetical protein
LAGITGQTNIPQVHFNVLIPVVDEFGLKSIPVSFMEGYIISNLQKKNSLLKNYSLRNVI